jgi:hypothetical protein
MRHTVQDDDLKSWRGVTHIAAGVAAAGAAAARNIKAIKAMGVVVQLEREEFSKLLSQAEDPLIVVAEAGFGLFGTKYKYLMSHKGLTFYTKAATRLRLPSAAEVVNAGRIWIPSYY